MSMTRPRGSLRPVLRVTLLYTSRQFLTYVMCGSLASLSQLGVRCLANLVMPFATAVVLSYGVGMIVALLLYRRFVFLRDDRSIHKQIVLFATSYILLFPLSFGVSIGAATLLSLALPTIEARLLGHAIGVGLPVFVNFAFNKFVTFRVPLAVQNRAP